MVLLTPKIIFQKSQDQATIVFKFGLGFSILQNNSIELMQLKLQNNPITVKTHAEDRKSVV